MTLKEKFPVKYTVCNEGKPEYYLRTNRQLSRSEIKIALDNKNFEDEEDGLPLQTLLVTDLLEESDVINWDEY